VSSGKAGGGKSTVAVNLACVPGPGSGLRVGTSWMLKYYGPNVSEPCSVAIEPLRCAAAADSRFSGPRLRSAGCGDGVEWAC